MSNIKNIFARQILDSRGIPTIEVDVLTDKGLLGRASVPSGASKGIYESIEIRDGNKDFFFGKSVIKAVSNVNNIIKSKLIGMSIFDQSKIDNFLINLDGSPNKNNLGANSILGVSLAIAKTASKELNIPLYKYIGGLNAKTLPIPMINIINGGSHSDAFLAFQEFMIIPIKAENFFHAIRIGVEIFFSLKKILKDKNMSISVGDEGGFAPKISSIEEAIEIIIESIEKTKKYIPGKDVMLALDCAASEFYINNMYDYTYFEKKNGNIFSSEEQVNYLVKLTQKYPIISIEDGLDQNDLNGWKLLTNKLGNNIQLVGDDLFVTNIKLLEKGINNSIANSILIKPNQIGTLTETMLTINKAQNNRYNTIMSHRSGETEDNIIADLSVGFNTRQIKTGSVSRSDRNSKYNQLIRIEENLGKNNAYYPNYKDIFFNYNNIF